MPVSLINTLINYAALTPVFITQSPWSKGVRDSSGFVFSFLFRSTKKIMAPPLCLLFVFFPKALLLWNKNQTGRSGTTLLRAWVKNEELANKCRVTRVNIYVTL